MQKSGILNGYTDGTFRPEKAVSRAEAVKIIVAPLISQQQINTEMSSAYTDVATDSWYFPYVEWARTERKIIDGPPHKVAFEGGRTVLLAEFLKMLQLAHGINANDNHTDIVLPISHDIQNTEEWYYPYFRYGLTASMLSVDSNGKFHPDKNITRADAALLLYHFLLYRENLRTQELLNQTERNIRITLRAWDKNYIAEAEYASARALLTARGALASSNEPLTKAVLEVAQAFRSLVRGNRAGLNGEYAETERLAGEAWHYAAAAMQHSVSLEPLASQIQSLAKIMADNAREEAKHL